MENQHPRSQEKLNMIMQHLPMGFAEIDNSGQIIYLNTQGEVLLKPIRVSNSINSDNLYPVLDHINPAIAKKIKEFPAEEGNILTNDQHSFSLSFGGETVERHFSFIVIKMCTGCVIIAFDDVTQRIGKDEAIQELQVERATLQGKFEIASNILHDIGNAVVAFGSYITRIRRTLEENSSDNLQNLAGFFIAQQTALNELFGEIKASAAVNMLKGIADGQKKSQEEINKSITEQLNVITHIQGILNIQRQYINGQETYERKPVRLINIVDDCYSMLFASLEKRGIKSSISMPENLPFINADRNSLMQVILNILKNSIEAIDPTAELKNISVDAIANDGIIILKVQDNGSGFDKATGEQIFKRGFTTKASGSGLGLSHCRTIIEKQGGTMDMTSGGFGKGAQTIIKFKI